MTNRANRLFEDAAEQILHTTWEHYPSMAAGLGLHEYDGRLPSVSRTAYSMRLREIERGLEALERIDDSALSVRNYYDSRILKDALHKERLEIAELQWYAKNPMEMLWNIEMSGYISRNYAPLEQRVESLTQALSSVPRYIDELKTVLNGRLASPVLEASIEAYEGIAAFYDTDLTAAAHNVQDDSLRARFDAACASASAAVRSFVELLGALRPYADASFAIGSAKFSALLKYGEMVDLPLYRLLDVGEANLRRNLTAFKRTAAQIDSNRPAAEVIASVAADHPTAESLLDETRDMLEDIRQYLIDENIVSVPSEVRCRTVETPAFMRWAFAALDFPGPYEQHATETYYYVTPVETHWSDAEKEQWLTAFNYATLKAVSIHEAYPGHYVHYLHTRNSNSMISRVFGAYSFWEGWAHYTEQMMLETGYGGDDPRIALGQLMEALLRNCRYICAIRMHTQGMTTDEATQFFMDNAYMEELPARKEALRGTFDPMYLNYTLGKLMILKLRDDYRQAQGDAYTLKRFHDAFLSFGAPPVPLVREMMLGAQGDVL